MFIDDFNRWFTMQRPGVRTKWHDSRERRSASWITTITVTIFGEHREVRSRRFCHRDVPLFRWWRGKASAGIGRARRHLQFANVILAAITSNLTHAADPASLLIDVSTTDGKESGLVQNSVVTCINLATNDTSLVAKRIGKLPTSTMLRIDLCLKTALGIN